MINIVTTGRWPKTDLVVEYAENVLEHFFRGRLKRNVDVNIVLEHHLAGGCAGFCTGSKSEITIEIARNLKRSGEVEHLSLSYMLRTLAHELVHAKQFIRGEINGLNEIYNKDRIDYCKAPYNTLPWEHEAFMMEDFLYKVYWQNRNKIDLSRKVL